MSAVLEREEAVLAGWKAGPDPAATRSESTWP